MPIWRLPPQPQPPPPPPHSPQPGAGQAPLIHVVPPPPPPPPPAQVLLPVQPQPGAGQAPLIHVLPVPPPPPPIAQQPHQFPAQTTPFTSPAPGSGLQPKPQVQPLPAAQQVALVAHQTTAFTSPPAGPAALFQWRAALVVPRPPTPTWFASVLSGVVTVTTVQRRTLSLLGARVGSRQAR